MSGYLAIFQILKKSYFQYRLAALVGSFIQLFWGIVNVMVYQAFYRGNPFVEPLSLDQVITFIWIEQALVQILPWSVDHDIETQIKNGNVAYELIRPIHLYGMWFARSLALRSVPILMRSIPVFVFGGWLFGLAFPTSWAAGSVFLISVIFGLFLSSAITTLVLISLFWTISGEGIQRLVPYFAVFFSGIIVPLPLFPEWAQSFLDIQPFRGLLDIPCRLYTGMIPIMEAPYYLGFQIAWILFFIGLGSFLMKRAMKRFVIQGG